MARPRAVYPALGFLLLAVGSAMSGVNLTIADRAVRLDHLGSLLLGARLAYEVVLGRRLVIDGSTLALFAYLAVTALSSAIAAPNPANSLLQTANLATLALVYVWLINFLDGPPAFERFLRLNMLVALCAVGIGVGFYLAFLAGLGNYFETIGFTDSEQVGYGAIGTMREANIFGSYALLFFVLGLTTVVGPALVPRLKQLARLRLVAGIGLVLSFTRASWLGALAVALPLLVSLRRRINWRLIGALAAGAALAVAVAASPLVPANYLSYKVQNLFNFSEGTAAGRIWTWQTAMAEFSERPWLGWGCYSYGDLHSLPGQDRATLPWIGNWLVTVLHDSGVVGTVFFGGFLLANTVGGLRAARRLWRVDQTAAVRLIGLVYGVIALLIAFFATTGFSFGYPWIALGMVGAYRRYARTGR